MATRSPLRLSIQPVDLPALRYRHSSVFLRPRFPFPKALLTSKAPKPLLTSKGTTAACHCVPKGTYVPLSQKAVANNSQLLFTLLMYIVLLFMYSVLLFPSILRRLHNLLPYPRQTLMISEFVGSKYNFMYPAVEAYLISKFRHTLMVLTVFSYKNQKGVTFNLPEYHEIEDVFEGTQYSWRLVRLGKGGKEQDPRKFGPFYHRGTRAFYVTFYHAEQEKTLKSYFPHIKAFHKAKGAGATVHVSNLSKDTRRSDLYNLFINFGPVSRVSIGYDQKTDMSSGIGVVNFVHKGDAEKAIAKLNGCEFDNLVLRVEWAEQESNIAKVEWVAR